MDTAILQPGTKKITLDYSEALYAKIKSYANEQGISEEQAFKQLAEDALRLKDLSRGVVTALSPEVQELIKQLQFETLEDYRSHHQQLAEDAAKAQQTETVAAAEVTKPVNENTISFQASAEIKTLISELNKTRLTKGLATIENSIAELLFHWAENMADHSTFTKTTGIDFDSFYEVIKRLALAERETNGAKSNVIETTGFFSSHSIVETPIVNG